MEVSRWVIHVDMDAFFAAIEQRDKPDFRGKPVIVGGDPQGRGVVSSASYEARQYGIKSAMPCAQAQRRCPRAVFLPVDMGKYRQVSSEVMQILAGYTPLVEQVSVDEAFLDVTGSGRLFGTAEHIAHQIRRRIKEELGLTASVGVAPNKFIAKLASEEAKSDGLMVIEEEEAQDFLAELPVTHLWGVGKSTADRLHRLGISTVAQLREYPEEVLISHFGMQGQHLYRLARGQDDSPVQPDGERKSVSHEITFAEDTAALEVLRATLLQLSEQVGQRLRAYNLRGRTVTLKLRFSDFTTITRRETLPEATDSDEPIYRAAGRLLEAVKLGRRKVRLVGVGVSNFDRTGQLALLPTDEGQRPPLDKPLDKLRERFGPNSIKRARLLDEQTEQ